jgi:hypothetical protein
MLRVRCDHVNASRRAVEGRSNPVWPTIEHAAGAVKELIEQGRVRHFAGKVDAVLGTLPLLSNDLTRAYDFTKAAKAEPPATCGTGKPRA